MQQKAYIEEQVLDQYLWHNFHHLTTRFEGLALLALSHGMEGTTVLQSIEGTDDPAVIQAFNERDPNFRAEVMKRITRDHSKDVIINRCPACKRIVATPRAQQCLWCFHDWHPSA